MEKNFEIKKNRDKSDANNTDEIVNDEMTGFGLAWPFDVPDSVFAETGRINSPARGTYRKKESEVQKE